MTLPSAPALEHVLETALDVDDLDAARRFYADLLGGRVMLESHRLVALSLGAPSVLLLFRRGTTEEPSATPGGVVPGHGSRGVQHLAFAVGDHAALDAWRRRIEAAGIPVESVVDWPRGGRSLYVRDPDGHSVELATRGLWPSY